MENQQNKLFIYLLVGFFAVFFGTGIFLLVSNNNESDQTQQTGAQTTSTLQQEKMVIPTVMPTKGSLKLTSDLPEVVLDSNLNLNIVADSAEENISAYDVLMSYDPLAFDFVEAKSLDPAFQAYSYKKDNRLSLTVVKTSQDSTPSIFKNTPVIKITFKPKKIGQFAFTIMPGFDKETTKLVNEKTEVVYPEVNEVNLIVK